MPPAATPPRVGLIVRRGSDGRWRDDNIGDWTEFVSGSLASASGRRPGWNLLDHDLAVIDVETLGVRYVTGLMNIGMALAVNPASGEATLVGTEAFNEVRFEPKVNGKFVRTHLARVNTAAGGSKAIVDLNPHLDYRQSTVPQAQRDRSIGDPRAIVWRADGQRGWVAGLGSNNIIAIDANGARVGNPIEVGEGPAGLAHDNARNRLYVWNHFEASLSLVDSAAGVELSRGHCCTTPIARRDWARCRAPRAMWMRGWTGWRGTSAIRRCRRSASTRTASPCSGRRVARTGTA